VAAAAPLLDQLLEALRALHPAGGVGTAVLSRTVSARTSPAPSAAHKSVPVIKVVLIDRLP
jgi:hypothetical protein